MSTTRIICAGFGGQGIMTLGKIIAAAGMNEGKHVTWMPSYGAEVRGGTAHSMVIISKEDIPSPVVNTADICVVMNKPSFGKFIFRVKPKGTLIINSSLVDSEAEGNNIKIIKVPATEIAISLGNAKVANMAALGALVSGTHTVSEDTVIPLLEEMFAGKKELLHLNREAFKKGLAYKE